MYWITKNLATSSMSEFMLRKRKNVVVVDVRDLIDGEGNDFEVFMGKVEEVENLINVNQKVCICCESGISRSNAVALAYLVKSSMKFDDAYNMIRKKVPVVQIDMALLDLAKKMKVHYPTVEDVVSTNRGIVQGDIKKVKEQLKNPKLTEEERAFLKRLLAKKEGKFSMEECIAIEKEGEIWLKRKDRNFDFGDDTDDILTD
jgi:hypothetical protein